MILALLASLPARTTGGDDALLRQVASPWESEIVRDATIRVGDAEFQLQEPDGVLRVRVLIASAPSVEPGENERLEYARSLLEALNEARDDFDSAGGFFVWDRSQEAYFLCRDFRLTSSEASFQDEIDELLEAAEHWRIEWFSQVSLRLADRR